MLRFQVSREGYVYCNDLLTAKPWFTELLMHRNRRGQNNMILICGESGIGKSALELCLCEIHSKIWKRPFTEKNIVFSAKEFFDNVNELKPYSWVAVDEPAVEVLSHREWFQELNRIICYTCESFRSYLLNVVFTSVAPTLIDTIIRTHLIHFLINVTDRGKAVVYRHLPSIFEKGRIRTPRLGELYYSLPSKELWQRYLDKKARFQRAKYASYREEATEKHETSKRFPTLFREACTLLATEPNRLLDHKGKISEGKIMLEWPIGRKKAMGLKKLLQERVYDNSEKEP